jgi:hypothetical protein
MKGGGRTRRKGSPWESTRWVRHGRASRRGCVIAGVFSLILACMGWWAPGAAHQTRTEVTAEGRFEGKDGMLKRKARCEQHLAAAQQELNAYFTTVRGGRGGQRSPPGTGGSAMASGCK